MKVLLSLYPRLSWRCRGDHGGTATILLQIGPTRGGTAEVLNMFRVSAVPPRRSTVLTVYRCATAFNDGTTAEPRRSWRCYCGLCRTSTAVAVAQRLRCDGGITDCEMGKYQQDIHPSHATTMVSQSQIVPTVEMCIGNAPVQSCLQREIVIRPYKNFALV